MTSRRQFPARAWRPCAMPLPELVAPVLAAGGPVAVIAVTLRFGPDAVLRLLAGSIAVLTRDENRGKRCLEVLRLLRRDGPRWRGGPRPLD
jgi:hypothetical protein